MVLSSQAFIPGAFSASPAANIESSLKSAQANLDANQFAKAEKLLRSLLKSEPDNYKVALLHSIALYRQGRFHAAQDELEKLTKNDDATSDAWLYLARTYQKIGKLKKSIETYNTFLEKVPKSFADRDKYKTLIMLIENQMKSEKSKQVASNKVGNYLGDVTGNGIFRWPDSKIPITVYIKDGEGVPGYRVDFDESIRDAFDQWEIKTRGLIKFKLVQEPGKALMKVSWTNDLHSAPLKAEMGHAKLFSDGEGTSKADIELLTVDPFKEGPVGKRLMRNVCLHEVGHALGLQGHSPYKSDIMYPQLAIQDGISYRDLSTLSALYSKDARNKVFSAKPTIRQSSKAREANLYASEGSRLAVAGKYREAYELLSKAMKLSTKNDIVRKNLSAVTNNLALKESDPEKAIALIHESLYWEEKENTRANLSIYLRRINVDSQNYSERIELSEKCLKKGDKIGALVELKEAFRLKESAELKKRIEVLEGELKAK